jgi:hypothetical protein
VIWFAWANVSALRGNTGSGPIRSVNKGAKQLLAQAKQAYSQQDFREAARLGHLLRREANVAEDVARDGFLILGLSCARIGEHNEALAYLRNQPLTPDVVEARIECLFALNRTDELNQLLDSPAFQKLPAERRREILEIVRADL